MATKETPPAKRQRLRTGLIVAAAVVVGLLVGMIVLVATRTKPTPGAASPASSIASAGLSNPGVKPAQSLAPAQSAAPRSADGVSGSEANGCLGGADPYSAVLTAQQQATPDLHGAAALARAITRWDLTYPMDPNASTVLRTLSGPGGTVQPLVDEMTKASETLAAAGYTQARTVPNLGQYRLDNTGATATGTAFVVQVTVYRELLNGTASTDQVKITTDLQLELRNGKWFLVGPTPPQIAPDPDVATANPWIPFSGAC